MKFKTNKNNNEIQKKCIISVLKVVSIDVSCNANYLPYKFT